MSSIISCDLGDMLALRFRCFCWFYVGACLRKVGAMLAHVCARLVLCWRMFGQGWCYVGAMFVLGWRYVIAMFVQGWRQVGVMFAQG